MNGQGWEAVHVLTETGVTSGFVQPHDYPVKCRMVSAANSVGGVACYDDGVLVGRVVSD